jgi:hypothetical protein
MTPPTGRVLDDKTLWILHRSGSLETEPEASGNLDPLRLIHAKSTTHLSDRHGVTPIELDGGGRPAT